MNKICSAINWRWTNSYLALSSENAHFLHGMHSSCPEYTDKYTVIRSFWEWHSHLHEELHWEKNPVKVSSGWGRNSFILFLIRLHECVGFTTFTTCKFMYKRQTLIPPYIFFTPFSLLEVPIHTQNLHVYNFLCVCVWENVRRISSGLLVFVFPFHFPLHVSLVVSSRLDSTSTVQVTGNPITNAE
jgi:hypothetical protein